MTLAIGARTERGREREREREREIDSHCKEPDALLYSNALFRSASLALGARSDSDPIYDNESRDLWPSYNGDTREGARDAVDVNLEFASAVHPSIRASIKSASFLRWMGATAPAADVTRLHSPSTNLPLAFRRSRPHGLRPRETAALVKPSDTV